MKTPIFLAVAGVAGVIAFRCLPHEVRSRVTSSIKNRISQHCEHMIAGLPEGSPPKLIMSVLPKLQAQNDQIITMLKEQNEILRERQPTSVARTAA